MEKARNEMLTRVGPGTPMGELLRRYWHPIAGASELVENPIKPIRLMGEDLVLLPGLERPLWIARPALSAPARRLSYGFVEKAGIRCNYHGWLMDEKGGCVEQPFEDTFNPSFAAAQEVHQPGLSGTRIGRTPVGLHGSRARRRNCRYGSRSPGRMGSRRSSPARCRATGSSVRKTRLIRSTSSGCTTTGACASAGRPARTRHASQAWVRRVRIRLHYRRVREGMTDQDPMWTIGRVTLWPNGFFLGSISNGAFRSTTKIH